MASPNLLRRIRWSWTLPLAASAITATLIIVAQRDNAAFWATHPGISDTPWEFQSPAILLAQALNGPGWFLFPFRVTGWIRLLGVILFWAWLGRGIDRRLHGKKIIIHSHLRRIVGNSALLCIAALFTFVFLTLLHGQDLLPFDRAFSGLMWSTFTAPWNMKLRLTSLGWYVGLVWSLVYIFYFGVNLFRAVTATLPKSDVRSALP